MGVKSVAVRLGSLLLVLSGAIAAQDGAKAPAIPSANRAEILEIQLRMVRAQSEYAQLQQRLRQLETDFQKDAKALQDAETEACKAAKVDCEKEWTVDLDRVAFVAKTKPAEAKKP